MSCPWRGTLEVDCDNTATPIVDTAMLREFESEGVDFQVRLFETATNDAGVCAGMTMKWCEAVFKGEGDLRHPAAWHIGLIPMSGTSRYSPGESVRRLHGVYNLEYAKRLLHKPDATPVHKKKRAAQMATAASLQLRATRVYKGAPDAAFLQSVRGILAAGHLVLLSIRLEIQNQNAKFGTASGWHAMGVSPKVGAKAIFDPNWGLFGYADDAELLEALRRAMLNYFTRGGNAALQVRQVKVASIERGMGFQEWRENPDDDLDALLASVMKTPSV